jgi:hypothetical protein
VRVIVLAPEELPEGQQPAERAPIERTPLKVQLPA